MDVVDNQIFKSEIFLPEVMRQQKHLPAISTARNLTPDELKALEAQRSSDAVNAWVVLSRAYDRAYSKYVEGYVEAIANLRDITDESDDFTLSMGARMQGFQLDQAYYTRIARPTLSKMLPVLPQYMEYSSGQRWYDFLSLLLDGRVQVDPLYTEDYVNFKIAPGGKILQDGGNWFKTTHLQVRLSYIGYNNVLTSLGQTFNTEAAEQILNEYMPINLVVDHLGFYVGFEIKVGIGIEMIGTSARSLIGNYDRDPKLAVYGHLARGKTL